ncbi:MAG: type II toxin-antitoxin system RelE/ParE family toxin [Thermoleophilia bacterium]|nr:type II toxin-antitoxin system RelE/ParE family toxin [Thermoleophilia bacterium]
MARVELTGLAQEDLDRLYETLSLPADARERILRSLRTLEDFPKAGKLLAGVWRDCRALIGPFGWLIVVYTYVEKDDRVIVVAFHDARTSNAATGGR